MMRSDLFYDRGYLDGQAGDERLLPELSIESDSFMYNSGYSDALIRIPRIYPEPTDEERLKFVNDLMREYE